jgi:alpha-L-rhamnosidase
VIGGLKAIEPGWCVIGIEPIPGGGLDWAETKHITPYGECAVRWNIKADKEGKEKLLCVHVLIPPNTTAEVKLPGNDEVKLVRSGTYKWELPYIDEEWPPRAIYPPTMPADDELPKDNELPENRFVT